MQIFCVVDKLDFLKIRLFFEQNKHHMEFAFQFSK